ncbi:hypothetical protein SDC9_105033 [bioreactor metagenome]|uniref:Uncharacterized protein n=1 Tax=bioreactor metagenome TaxID=1076179 RepID=A0A645B4X5_9ZZZZ
MDALFLRVGLPDLVIGLDVDAFQAVPGDDVEIAHRFVVFRRVAGGDDDPARGDAVLAEYLILKELEHTGGERFGDAVDLVEEKDALPHPRLLHQAVDGADYLAHRIFGDLVLFAAELPRRDVGQAQRALARMVGHGIGDEANAELRGYLLHDGGLADAGRPDHEYGALFFHRDAVSAEFVLCKVGGHRVLYLLFGLRYVQKDPSLTNTVNHLKNIWRRCLLRAVCRCRTRAAAPRSPPLFSAVRAPAPRGTPPPKAARGA